jgi:hypothetical protein
MAHELSQSEGLCDWWNDYHYGYNHADTTPWYIVAMADYVRTSGDVEFLKQSWKSVKLAYDWCLSKDSDGDGLMDLKGAGLGALEFGKLVGIYADVYTCGVFLQAVKEMKYMAGLVGDSVQANQADAQFRKAQPRMEKLFWLEKEGFYAYGATDKGEQVHEKTPWSGVAMMFGLLIEERSAKSIEALNSADICTDWGVRSLSNKSELFEPTNYNYGAVWPFISSFFNTAQFKHHYGLSGYQILQSNIKHVFDHALGVVPEVFSGELNEKLGEGYHHQGFSTTGYMLPLVRGFLGLEVDGVGKRILFADHLNYHRIPSVSITQMVVGLDSVNLTFHRSEYGPKLVTRLAMGRNGPEPIQIVYSPSLPFGGELENNGVLDGKLLIARSHATSQDVHVDSTFVLNDTAVVEIGGISYLQLSPRESEKEVGAKNNSLRIISQKFSDRRLTLLVEGLRGSSYDLGIGNRSEYGVSVPIKHYSYSTIDWLTIEFDSRTTEEFARKEIVIHLK